MVAKELSKTSVRMIQYESCFSQKLPPKFPYIIRVHMHGFDKINSYGTLNQNLMSTSFKYVAQQMADIIQGCVFTQTTPPEICFVVLNNKNEDTQPWFNGDMSSIVSTTASLATAHFMSFLSQCGVANFTNIVPLFKARVCALPDMEEVQNYLSWRKIETAPKEIRYVVIRERTEIIVSDDLIKQNENLLNMIQRAYNSYIEKENEGEKNAS